MLVKVSFNGPLPDTPKLRIGSAEFAGRMNDTAGVFWQFYAIGLEPNTPYSLSLAGGDGRALCEPWKLSTFPAPHTLPERFRLLFFTCAGGPGGTYSGIGKRSGFLPAAIRNRLLRRALSLRPHAAVANGDRLGGLIFSDREHVELRPRLGRRAALRMLRVICDTAFWEPPYAATAAVQPHSLERLTRVARPGSQIFLLSDFRSLDASFERHLRQLARHSDVSLVHFFDPVERSLPPPGRYRVLAGSRSVAIDTGGDAERRAYRDRFIERRAALAKLARFPGVQVLECGTHGDPQKVLSARFAGR